MPEPAEQRRRPRSRPAPTARAAPRWRARPAATPPMIGSCVSRVARRTSVGGRRWVQWSSSRPSSHSARTPDHEGRPRPDPEPATRPGGRRIRVVPDGARGSPTRAGLSHDNDTARSPVRPEPGPARRRPTAPRRAPASPATRSATSAGSAAASPTARSPASPAASARHLDIDPLILRVAFVVLVFFGGAGLILYGACWLLVPEEGQRVRAARPRRPQPLDRPDPRRRRRGAWRCSATRRAPSGSPGRWRSSRWSSCCSSTAGTGRRPPVPAGLAAGAPPPATPPTAVRRAAADARRAHEPPTYQGPRRRRAGPRTYAAQGYAAPAYQPYGPTQYPPPDARAPQARPDPVLVHARADRARRGRARASSTWPGLAVADPAYPALAVGDQRR